MNLTDLFRITFQSLRGKPAIAFEGEILTFGEMDARSNRVAGAFQRLGLVKGDRVAFYLGNSLELIFAYLANLKLGLITVPMNTQYRDTEIMHIVGDAAPRVILTDRARWKTLDPLRERFQSVERIIVAEDFAELASEESVDPVAVRVDEDDLAAIMYTSGTTGRSKGAMITHGNFVSNITGILSAWHWTAEDTLLLTLPLFHMHGLGVALHGALATGSTVLLHRAFGASAVLDALLANRTTLFMGVPTMYVRLLQEAERRNLSRVAVPRMRLFVSGSAPLSIETFRTFERVFGHTILERYGMTETAMNTSNLYAGPRIPGTVGVALPGVSARVGDAQGNPVPDGDIGEVLIRGSNVFRGYWQAPDKTAEAFVTDDEGARWFRTGDLGRREPANGFLTLVGRKHDLIISGGFNIYPREVEEVLLAHPAVLEAAVSGAPDTDKGEIPVAFIVLRPDTSVKVEQLQAHCAAHLAHFKVPRSITFLAELPRNAMGKVERQKLAAASS